MQENFMNHGKHEILKSSIELDQSDNFLMNECQKSIFVTNIDSQQSLDILRAENEDVKHANLAAMESLDLNK